MVYYIFIALMNGFIIGVSRGMNSRLSMSVGAFKASFWNHTVGFLFLTAALLLFNNVTLSVFYNIPAFTYLGGLLGALFVAVNSYVFPKIGVKKTVLLVISGQMITSVFIDYKDGVTFSIQLLGILMIIAGMYLSLFRKNAHKKSGEQ
jgi:bacterial/archaeal transporter family-2 protein